MYVHPSMFYYVVFKSTRLLFLPVPIHYCHPLQPKSYLVKIWVKNSFLDSYWNGVSEKSIHKEIDPFPGPFCPRDDTFGLRSEPSLKRPPCFSPKSSLRIYQLRLILVWTVFHFVSTFNFWFFFNFKGLDSWLEIKRDDEILISLIGMGLLDEMFYIRRLSGWDC